MTDRHLIIDRIEKLFALASGGASEHEAKTAIAMAHKLMTKYGIAEFEVNKETYTRGETTQRHRQSSRDDYEDWVNRHHQQRAHRWQHEWQHYYQQTFEPTFIVADLMRESVKAYMIAIHLDETKYPWTHIRPIKVVTWIPKSRVQSHVGNLWIVDTRILLSNLKKDIPYLIQHHSVFKGQGSVTFYFKKAF